MKIEPIEIEQDPYTVLLINVSLFDTVEIVQDADSVFVQRDKIQELIDILENEKL